MLGQLTTPLKLLTPWCLAAMFAGVVGSQPAAAQVGSEEVQISVAAFDFFVDSLPRGEAVIPIPRNADGATRTFLRRVARLVDVPLSRRDLWAECTTEECEVPEGQVLLGFARAEVEADSARVSLIWGQVKGRDIEEGDVRILLRRVHGEWRGVRVVGRSVG